MCVSTTGGQGSKTPIRWQPLDSFTSWRITACLWWLLWLDHVADWTHWRQMDEQTVRCRQEMFPGPNPKANLFQCVSPPPIFNYHCLSQTFPQSVSRLSTWTAQDTHSNTDNITKSQLITLRALTLTEKKHLTLFQKASACFTAEHNSLGVTDIYSLVKRSHCLQHYLTILSKENGKLYPENLIIWSHNQQRANMNWDVTVKRHPFGLFTITPFASLKGAWAISTVNELSEREKKTFRNRKEKLKFEMWILVFSLYAQEYIFSKADGGEASKQWSSLGVLSGGVYTLCLSKLEPLAVPGFAHPDMAADQSDSCSHTTLYLLP